ncbi:hypothetical protein [Kitasatospora cinereorecta]|uniref:WD40 repeat domain-containing protein n=1 Tax=Kitasatospora cinereorecta TaxID=285560 RepID=A0ABW0VNV4_9ACTN
MSAKLPLDSPRWSELGGVAVDEVRQVMAAMEAVTADTSGDGSGDGWYEVWRGVADGVMREDIVLDGAYAVLPHVVDTASALPPERFVEFWVDLGFLVTAAGRRPVPADLQAGLDAALRRAERSAVRALLAADTPAVECARLALSCVALTGHHIAEVLWRFLDPEETYLVLVCPECDTEIELADFLVDPVRPPFEAPASPDAEADADAGRDGGHPWGEVAAALRDDALGEGWEPFVRVAREVAAAGVPRETSGQAVLCLAAAMVAVKGAPGWAGAQWARTLMLLTGSHHCPDCEQTWTTADCLVPHPDGARPYSDGPAVRSTLDGNRPAGGGRNRLRRDGNRLLTADGTPGGQVTEFGAPEATAGEGVNALAVVVRPGLPTLVVSAGDSGTLRLWDPADGRLRLGPLTGHPDRVRSLTALALPDGTVLTASGGDTGTVGLWDATTGQPVLRPVGNWLGEVIGMCAAALPDGRTVLVTATSRGAVRLRDPRTGDPLARLNPQGRPITSIAAVPIAADHTLIAAADAQGDVHLWDPTVDDPWDRGAAVPPNARTLGDLRHRVTAVAAAPTYGRTLLATGDRNGVVLLWDPETGLPVGDGLPPDTAGGPVTALTALTLPGRPGVVISGSRQGRSVRIWEPETGAVRRVELDVAVTCLAAAAAAAGTGVEVIVGHDRGVLRLSVTAQPVGPVKSS